MTRPPTINMDDIEPEMDFNTTDFDTGPSPSPLPAFTRSASPAKSGKSIHWALTQYRNIHVDKKVWISPLFVYPNSHLTVDPS